jgi:hypothetical protein
MNILTYIFGKDVFGVIRDYMMVDKKFVRYGHEEVCRSIRHLHKCRSSRCKKVFGCWVWEVKRKVKLHEIFDPYYIEQRELFNHGKMEVHCNCKWVGRQREPNIFVKSTDRGSSPRLRSIRRNYFCSQHCYEWFANKYLPRRYLKQK